ncbi:sodium:glutamate symporter [Vibrio coralliilyticus]|jgi:ESS family glutamate:Na+ symporter|uniref:Sodium/glutamate symporter n=1 Tax=Vibrio coralliilyticus TaxID=190893 RepID=A0A097B051_9VIBR|nr:MULTISPECIES: sodium/glutamate symporter [Vibrio]AIS58052.1 sodium:glutamate symporter [Vibrio coralliilyticus]AIW21984.1 sodium:glutamate symporter [Vibrio coralliilyticus]ANW26431.1 sodium/glutamate symporter [Vibrio coralliilyticus]ARC93860.1 sodium/glutamate symporter [Vibrio coralliilyticus]EEX32923.1 sodium/glutamate symporter [Vibrio coralliilyticus ATCC BAA-450]
MNQIISVGPLESFLIAISVLFLGHFVNSKLPILKKFNIPEPIVGGLIVAMIITGMHFNGVSLEFSLPLQNTFMLMFFSTVGLAANYTQLMKGGAKVFLFLAVASFYIIIQNGVGVSMATALGLDPLMGLIAGSITLSGGHGTGAAWSQTFTDTYGLSNTLEIAMASATFGLIIGGIIGSPVAQKLVTKHNFESEYGRGTQTHEKFPEVVTYNEYEEDKVTAKKVIEILFILLICVTGAKYLEQWVSSLEISWLMIPDFVYALFIGVFITNVMEVTKTHKVDAETVDILGTVSLSLFLAMALMSLKLWNIFDLAIPFLIILSVQSVILGIFAYFVTFKVMGSNYDAAVIAGGHCGFGLGATPTAVMNMGSLVNKFGPSPQAFMVVPIVGAFFIDIVNLIILQGYISFIG